MKQHFQDVVQHFMHDNNSDSFTDHFAKYFTQKLSLQQCCKIMSFVILYMVNPIGSMNTGGKLSYTTCMK